MHPILGRLRGAAHSTSDSSQVSKKDPAAKKPKTKVPPAEPKPVVQTKSVAADASPLANVAAPRQLVGPSLRALTEPVRQWIPGHQQRHVGREDLHRQIHAVALSPASDDARAAAWHAVAQACVAKHTSIGHQLDRCSGEKHILATLLEREDFDALGALAPHLASELAHHRVSRRTYGTVQVIVNKNGTYIGEAVVYRGKPTAHGRGRNVAPDGLVSQGEWRYGRLHGRGTEKDGDRVWHADYINGRRHGLQRTISPRQSVTTLLHDEVKHGLEVVDVAGNKSIWTWNMGKVAGFEQIGKDGWHYCGGVDEQRLKYHGEGTYTSADGAVYQGTYHLGLRHGAGSYTFSSDEPLFGYQFVGRYINDHAQGHGHFKNVVSGQTYPCFYRQGVLLTKAPPVAFEVIAQAPENQANSDMPSMHP